MHARRTAGRRRPTEAVSADVFTTLVRVHADRVHDFVRRQGCAPGLSAGVVEAGALDLIELAGDRTPVPELVGRWFALAHGLAKRVGSEDDTRLPVGSGLLAEDAEQELLAAGLERCDTRSRTALLLRDAYDLPPAAVAAALGLDPQAAMRVVGQARLELLPAVLPDDAPGRPAHGTDDATLARLADGTADPADRSAIQHALSCAACGEIVHAQKDVRRLLAGLSVVAVPDELRDALLERVAVRARAALPEQEAVLADEPRRLLSVGPVLFALLLAVLAGVGLGALLSQPSSVRSARVGPLPVVTAPAVTPLPGLPTAGPPTEAQPRTTVFTYPPTRPPAPPTTAPPPPSSPPPFSPPPTTPPAAPATLTVAPASGAAAAELVVTGSGWTAGSEVTVVLLNPQGEPTGSTAKATVSAAGRFRATLTAGPADAPAGAYPVEAKEGTQSARATYTIV